MRLTVGALDVTRRFVLSHSVTLSGERGLRSIRYRTERTADKMAFTSRDDRQPIRCVVTVPGLPANHTAVKIDVLCTYIRQIISLHGPFSDYWRQLNSVKLSAPPQEFVVASSHQLWRYALDPPLYVIRSSSSNSSSSSSKV